MAVTELATLAIKPPHAVDTPALIEGLREVAKKQAAWSGFPLHFFYDGASRIYLISGWESVEAHNEWIRSEVNQGLLVMLDEYLGVEDFMHLDVELDEKFLEQKTISCDRHGDEFSSRGKGGWSLDAKARTWVVFSDSEGSGLERMGV